uniref:Stannin n=1 Tax=Sarcophilus harrisii TaxID=9305 RepID=A0A7N4NTL0_SARHA
MSIMDHSPTTGVVTVIVILIAIAALGALILGCWCYLRLQRISQSEDEESIVGDGETKEPFLLVQYSAKGEPTSSPRLKGMQWRCETAVHKPKMSKF